MSDMGTTASTESPSRTLGVDETASAEEIRRAYLEKIKQYPPEKFPDQFEKLRDAYQILSDPKKRALQMIMAVDPGASIVRLLDGLKPERRFTGPAPWLTAMKERQKP